MIQTKTRTRHLRPGITLLGAAAILAMWLTVAPGVAEAAVFRAGEAVGVADSEVIQDDLYIAGNDVDVAGDIQGDVYAVGQNVRITGNVSGDVIAAGQTVTISGAVEDGVKAAGQMVAIGGRVQEDVFMAGSDVSLSPEGGAGRDLLVAGAVARITGGVGRDLSAAAEDMTVGGAVGRNVSAEVSRLHLAQGADIKGRLSYTSEQRAVKDTGARVGEERFVRAQPQEKKEGETGAKGFDLAGFILSFLMIIVIGLILRALFPSAAVATVATLKEKPLPSLGWGLLILIVAPIAAIMIMITIVGLPTGLLLLILGAFAMYLSKLVTGGWVGGLIMERLSPGKSQPVVALLVGVLLVSLLAAVPVIGGLVGFASLLFGLGAMTMAAGAAIGGSRRQHRENPPSASGAMAPSPDAPAAPATAAPAGN